MSCGFLETTQMQKLQQSRHISRLLVKGLTQNVELRLLNSSSSVKDISLLRLSPLSFTGNTFCKSKPQRVNALQYHRTQFFSESSNFGAQFSPLSTWKRQTRQIHARVAEAEPESLKDDNSSSYDAGQIQVILTKIQFLYFGSEITA